MLIGTLLIGKENNAYDLTNDKTLCLVESIDTSDVENDIRVRTITSTIDSMYDSYTESLYDHVFWVNSSEFEEISIFEYFMTFPDAWKIKKFDEVIREYNIDISEAHSELIKQRVAERKRKEEEDRCAKFANAYNFTDEEHKNLVDEITTLLKTYNYHPTEKGIDAFLDEWRLNKAPLIKLFQNHPNYNGKYQIVFDTDYDREVNIPMAKNFLNYMCSTFVKKHEIVMFDCSYNDAKQKKNNLSDILIYIDDIIRLLNIDGENIDDNIVTINGHNIEYYRNEYEKYSSIYDAYRCEIREDKLISIAGRYMLLRKDYERYCALKHVIDYLSYETFIDEEFAKIINHNFDIKAVAGQKLSRVINKLCHTLEIDKDENYNKEFAKFSDAVNPLSIKRHTVISCHPVDYFTMSFGNSWASCHTIDKKNIRRLTDSFEGMYSGGTMSYMLDGTSVVFYTVDNKYNGNELELEPKINRNMFHIGEDKIVQGRVYPQCNDGTTNIYDKFRNIMQKVIADCMGKNNLWKLKRGTDECIEVIDSCGVHYRDYEKFDSCNVSYLKLEDGTYNENSIIVGHKPICPSCGREHTIKSNIECSRCNG